MLRCSCANFAYFLSRILNIFVQTVIESENAYKLRVPHCKYAVHVIVGVAVPFWVAECKWPGLARPFRQRTPDLASSGLPGTAFDFSPVHTDIAQRPVIEARQLANGGTIARPGPKGGNKRSNPHDGLLSSFATRMMSLAGMAMLTFGRRGGSAKGSRPKHGYPADVTHTFHPSPNRVRIADEA
jgi:hypothetical protein